MICSYKGMNENFEYNQTHNMLNPRVGFATAASVLGLISIALILSAYFSIILGGIAITMAILSRESNGKLYPQAKRGILFGLVGLVGGYALMVTSFVTVFTDPEAHRMVNQYSQAATGQSFDDMLEELTGNLGISIDLPVESQ
ncbi:hypothetical protein [Butyrivibrio sp. VCD2006]|uniref:hypothetical protein n=1 Tax=Butyrivibrio sp. VCD2006 TaxID=1280664 RepID=UPI00047A232A|nr:hypothetical protein [Butyrivibrio sp. VCD2006]